MPILSLDVGGTAIKSGLFDSDAKPMDFRETPSHARDGGPSLMRRIGEVIEQYAGYDRISFSMTGQIDAEKGVVVFADDNVPDFTGTPVCQIIQDRFHVPVFIENDVNAAALGEAFYGAGVGYDDFICLTYGTGVGGAVILNRQVYRGVDGIAGEFGHIVTHAGGELCSCGLKGCYERYASTTALIRNCREKDAACTNGRIIFEKVVSKDDGILREVDAWIDEIVTGLVSLVHIFNPPCVVLGGGIMNEDYVSSRVSSRLKSSVMASFSRVEVRKAALGNKAGLIGAMHRACSQK